VGLRLPYTLSPSKISLFKDCALAFRYSAIDRVPEPPSLPASRGTLVHRTLERLLLEPAAQRDRQRAEVLLGESWRELAPTDEFAGLDLDDAAVETLHDDAGQLLDSYFALEDPTRVRPVGLEVMLSATVGPVKVRGILDRLELDAGGSLVVTDYKTGRSPSLYDERARLLGVTVYAYLCEEVLGQRPKEVQLLYLANREALVAVPTDQALRGLRQQVGAIWDAIVRSCRDDDFRARPGHRCDWCGYQTFCPAHGGSGPPRPENPQLTLFDVSELA
jgi:putative RecB family exonuclease